MFSKGVSFFFKLHPGISPEQVEDDTERNDHQYDHDQDHVTYGENLRGDSVRSVSSLHRLNSVHEN